MSNKILLIEDNREISDNIKDYLELEKFEVIQAFDWEKGLQLALEEKFDLILLDLMLPKMDWNFIAKKISKKIWIPIIMITAKDSIEQKLTWFENWAVDYIVKPFDLRELEARINANLKPCLKSWIIVFKDLKINLEKREFIKNNKEINLTTKEFLIFEYLIKNNFRVCTRTDLMDYVWGSNDLFGDDSKLDVYISNLRKKLDKDIIETVKWVWYKFGYKF